MNLATTLLPLALVLTAGCSGAGDDPARLTNDGYEELGSSHWAAAHRRFDKALAAIGDDPTHGQYERATLGSLRASAHLDPAAAVSRSMELAESGRLDADDLSQVGSELLDAGAKSEAVQLMDRALGHFAGSPELASLRDKIMAAADSDSDIANQLESLGYL